MKKIVYVDVGAHFAQEFQSILGSRRYFWSAIFRRLIGYYLLGRGDLTEFKNLKDLIHYRYYLHREKSSFLSFLVEANYRVIQTCSSYRAANGVFNCAITDEENYSIQNLYLGSGDYLSQGSSIYLSKGNVSAELALPTIGVPSNLFFLTLQKFISETESDYLVILRVNCEGVEDEVIYSAQKVFSDKLVLVLGSLKDVKLCKGDEAYEALLEFLHAKQLPFVFFSPSINSWHDAHKAIVKVHAVLESD